MSLWTPDGERPVSRPQPGGAPTPATPNIAPELRQALAEAGVDVEDLSPEQVAEATAMLAEMSQVRQDLLATPATHVIANHLMGIYELGAIHLGENPPNFGEAHHAIEALRAVLDHMGDAFGENEPVLRQALAQLQMAFVQLKEQVRPAPGDASAD